MGAKLAPVTSPSWTPDTGSLTQSSSRLILPHRSPSPRRPRSSSISRTSFPREARQPNTLVRQRPAPPINRPPTPHTLVTDTSYDPADRSDPGRAGPDRDVSILSHARIEQYDDAPDICTIYSALNRTTVRTTWISAKEGSYLSLEEAR